MESQRFDLTGKTALITGAGRGIGLAIARALAEHGVDVILVARSADQLQIAAREIEAGIGRHAWTLAFDLSKTNGVEHLFSDAVEAAGGVDILVNCAGTTVRKQPEDLSLEDFRRVMDVNLTSALVLSQAF